MPWGIDEGTVGPVWSSVLINVSLLGLFAVQHTVMARPAFKRRWTRLIPQPVERTTFLIDHFDQFGLRQVVARARQRTYEPPGFRQPLVYRLVRHPIMVGFVTAFWATPDMSAGRLLFAALGTGYIMIGVLFEERDLRRHLGEVYVTYESQVPRFVPRPRPQTLRTPGKEHD